MSDDWRRARPARSEGRRRDTPGPGPRRPSGRVRPGAAGPGPDRAGPPRPGPRLREERITLAHGAGGKATQTLIEAVFLEAFRNPLLEPLEDGAR